MNIRKRPMQTLLVSIAAIAALLALGSMSGPGEAAEPPVIYHVLVSDTQLTIVGDNLDLGVAPIVKLGSTQLAVQDSSPEEVKVQLPAEAEAGKYVLTLKRPDGGPTARVEISLGIAYRVPMTWFFGLVSTIAGNSGQYVFAGPTGSVTTTRPYQRLVGAATAPLGLTSGPGQTADVGLCWKAAAGPVLNFVLANFAVHNFTTVRASYSATAAMSMLEPGTYTVGLCVRNNGANPIGNNNYVNGWVMVLD